MVRKQGGSKSGSKVEAIGFGKNASTFITALYRDCSATHIPNFFGLLIYYIF